MTQTEQKHTDSQPPINSKETISSFELPIEITDPIIKVNEIIEGKLIYD